MKTTKITELMVPISEYETISQDASLHEAFLLMEDAYEKSRRRAILVRDDKNRIVGKLNRLDLLGALEPKYQDIGDMRSVSASGFSPGFIRSMIESYSLWQRPLDDICKKGATKRVKDISLSPINDKYIEEGATLDEAIHLFIVGHNQTLLVTKVKSDEVIGVLQLKDVFQEVCSIMRECEI